MCRIGAIVLITVLSAIFVWKNLWHSTRTRARGEYSSKLTVNGQEFELDYVNTSNRLSVLERGWPLPYEARVLSVKHPGNDPAVFLADDVEVMASFQYSPTLGLLFNTTLYFSVMIVIVALLKILEHGRKDSANTAHHQPNSKPSNRRLSGPAICGMLGVFIAFLMFMILRREARGGGLGVVLDAIFCVAASLLFGGLVEWRKRSAYRLLHFRLSTSILAFLLASGVLGLNLISHGSMPNSDGTVDYRVGFPEPAVVSSVTSGADHATMFIEGISLNKRVLSTVLGSLLFGIYFVLCASIIVEQAVPIQPTPTNDMNPMSRGKPGLAE